MGEDYRKVGFTIRAIAVEQFHSDASLETVDRRAPNNSKIWQWTMEGDVSHDYRHQFRMAVNDRTSSRQFETRWSIATSVLM